MVLDVLIFVYFLLLLSIFYNFICIIELVLFFNVCHISHKFSTNAYTAFFTSAVLIVLHISVSYFPSCYVIVVLFYIVLDFHICLLSVAC